MKKKKKNKPVDEIDLEPTVEQLEDIDEVNIYLGNPQWDDLDDLIEDDDDM